CDNRFAFLEGIQFGNVITEEYFLFKIRFIKGVNNTMRISFHNQIFEIKKIIDEDSKARILTIIALKI
nr:phage head closure protein [Rickettsiaceae bacterium]